MFFIFNAPNKAKEKLNVFFFKLLFFFIHCAVSNFGSVLWLKFEPCSPFEVETKWKWKKKIFNIVIIPLKKSSSCCFVVHFQYLIWFPLCNVRNVLRWVE